jgi:hypothetical protein
MLRRDVQKQVVSDRVNSLTAILEEELQLNDSKREDGATARVLRVAQASHQRLFY